MSRRLLEGPAEAFNGVGERRGQADKTAEGAEAGEVVEGEGAGVIEAGMDEAAVAVDTAMEQSAGTLGVGLEPRGTSRRRSRVQVGEVDDRPRAASPDGSASDSRK